MEREARLARGEEEEEEEVNIYAVNDDEVCDDGQGDVTFHVSSTLPRTCLLLCSALLSA